MVERAAFRAIMQFGGTIYDLSANEVSKPDAAIKNAEAVAEILAKAILNKQEVVA
jgi:chromosome partitioning protein